MILENFFKTHLKELRESHNLTMTELADILGMTSSAAVSQFETGKSLPSYYTLLQIALCFGVSLEWLSGLADIPYTEASITAAQKHLENRISTLKAGRIIKDTIALWRENQPIEYEYTSSDYELRVSEQNENVFVDKQYTSIIPNDANYVITGSLIFLIHATFLLDVERGELLKASDLIDFLSNENQMDRRQQLKYRKRERYIRLLEYYTRGWLS
ncbi:MAG: helix-turn-helix transcriptional regulator [Lachnospiraceae bacterium]|jgi:transcriptional regulator with XRE-family HTH domain|nr:helix-turn-helix transcriptional regulator [Lachnospiraceae bacterium]